MAQKQTIHKAGYQMEALANHIQQLFEDEEYDVQVLNLGNDILIQVRNTPEKDSSFSAWSKRLTGLSNVATLKLGRSGEDLEIESTSTKWLDKAAVAGVSLFMLWPLLITSGIGAYQQNQLIDRLFQESLAYLAKMNGTSFPEP